MSRPPGSSGPFIRALERIDRATVEFAAPYRDRGLVRLIGDVSELADQPPLAAYNLAVLAGGLLLGDRRAAATGLRMFAAHVAATQLKDLLKYLVTRTRPWVLIEEGRYEIRSFGPVTKDFTSFPSGHTAGAVAVARAAVRRYPGGRPAAYGAAGFAALAQIPRCAHFPSDVVAGVIVGVASEAMTNLLLDVIGKRLVAGGGEPR